MFVADEWMVLSGCQRCNGEYEDEHDNHMMYGTTDSKDTKITDS